MSITVRGPRCVRCGKTEQECAYRYPCCPACTSHYVGLDADGNDKPKPAPVVPIFRTDERPVCPACHRRVTERGRNDCPGLCADRQRAYWRTRARQRQAS